MKRIRACMASLLLAGAVLPIPAMAAPATTPAADIPLGNLSDVAVPLAYRLALTVAPEQERFSGHAEIDVTIAASTGLLYIHGNGLKVARITAKTGARTIVGHYAEVDDSGVARLTFDTPLPAGAVTLAFDYDAPFMSGGEGLYRAKVGADWYAWTQFEPIDARRMFPAFDQPGYKTPFTVSITAKTGQKVFANTPEAKATPIAGGMVRHDFAVSKPLPSYLVAIAVGPFDEINGVVPANAVRATPLTYRVIATRGQAARLKTAAEEGPKILALHEAYFGVPYPFEKLDLIASPILGGAMENAGLVAFNDTLLLLDPDAPISQRRNFGTVVAHELAHQWFGDLVTPKWWNDIWLNESFAEWAGNRTGDAWDPKLGTDTSQFSDALDAMDLDSLSAGRPIRQEIDRSAQISSAFDSITYLKGGQVLHMFEAYMGKDKWQRGVHAHLTRFAYKNADADDFFKSMAEGAGDPAIVPAFQSFVTQTGVPVVTIASSPQGLALSQARYHPIGVAAAAPQIWSIPFCVRQGEAKSCTLLPGASGTLALTGKGVVVPNADGAGYYRYSLDDADWATLMAGADKLPAREAMAAGDSLWSDFAAGHASFQRVTASARVLAHHPDRLPATLLAGHLETLSQTMLSDKAQPGFAKLMAEMYAPTLATLGLDLKRGAYASEDNDKRLLRQALATYVAIDAKAPALRAKLAAAAEAAVGGDANALDPGYRVTAFRVAVADRGAAFVEKAHAALLAGVDPLFRENLVSGLTEVATPALTAQVLAIAQDPKLQTMETLRLYLGIARVPAGREALLAKVRDNFGEVLKIVPGFARSSIPQLFASYCSTQKADEIDALIRPKLATMGGGELELRQTVEAIRVCAALKAAKGAEIEAAFGG